MYWKFSQNDGIWYPEDTVQEKGKMHHRKVLKIDWNSSGIQVSIRLDSKVNGEKMDVQKCFEFVITLLVQQ